MRTDLCGLSFAEFAAWARGLVGHSDRFHRALYRGLLSSGSWDPAADALWRAEAPQAIATMAGAAAADQAPAVVARREASDPQHGATVKVLARLADGAEVESVLIPMRGGAHRTVCVSSQVGCRMGCSFCHTAKMGLVRSLAAHEIVGQVVAVAAATGERPRNVVFMGMGEPLDNAEEVARAVRVLTDRDGLGIAPRHITVSTVGRVDGLARWDELGLARVNLAVSLGAADDALRSELMPVNRTAPLAELKRALLALPLRPGRRILVSYVVIPGVNDGEEHVAPLVAWLDGLSALVNLIPFNPIPSRPWRAPTAAEAEAFRARLDRERVPVRLRTTKGDEVMAACGQLGDPDKKRRTKGSQRIADGDRIDVAWDRLPLIARGRTADVLALDERRVFKRFHPWCPEAMVEREAIGSRAAEAAGLPVPKLLEVWRKDGRRGLVFERAEGETLLSAMLRDPATAMGSARLLAELHAGIHRHQAPGLPSARDRVVSAIGRAGMLDARRAAGMDALARSLPDGTILCHGDLHVGQILITRRGPMIVDWVDACRGEAAADVARSFLLLRVGAVPAAVAGVLTADYREAFAAEYLRRYLELAPGTSREGIAAWRAPLAAARLSEGIGEEREALLRIIDA